MIYDDIDCLVETLSGADTTHRVNGIVDSHSLKI